MANLHEIRDNLQFHKNFEGFSNFISDGFPTSNSLCEALGWMQNLYSPYYPKGDTAKNVIAMIT